MAQRITKEIVNERLFDRGITLVSEYVNNYTKTEFECANGHRWLSKPNNIMSGNRCPFCFDKRLTTEIVNERIKNLGIELVDEYVDAHTKVEHKCICGYHWRARPLSGGCPRCGGSLPLSKEIVNERLGDRGIDLVGEYINNYTITEFMCAENHRWSQTPGNVMSGCGCPYCSQRGFNPSKEAWEYILDFGYFLKFGITNNLSDRLKSHKKNGEYKVVHERHHQVGQLALDWENNIKRVYGGRYATKEQCPDGYTETICKTRLGELLEYIKGPQL